MNKLRKLQLKNTLLSSLMSPAVAVCGWYIWTCHPHTCWGHMAVIGPKYTNFTFSGYLAGWPHMTFDLHLWYLTSWTCKGSNMSIQVALTWPLTFICDIWSHEHVISPYIMLQGWDSSFITSRCISKSVKLT